MSYYVSGSKMSYSDYLTTKSFVSDVSSATRSAGRQVSMEISRRTREVIASNEAMARENIVAMEASTEQITDSMNDGFRQVTESQNSGFDLINSSLYHGFAQINGSLNQGFEKLSYDLKEVKSGISKLNATFHWGFSQAIASLGHMNDSLTELVKIAKTPVQTFAFNHFEIARDAFRQELYQECLDELQKAISGDNTSAGYKLEWRFHQMKGTIHLGFVGSDMSLVDLAKAEESFLLAARYGKADYPEDAARAFLSAGWAAYCQGKMKDALSYTEQTITLLPRMGEALFQSAKVQMAMGQVDAALPVLYKAIEIDRFYAFKAAGDGDFQKYNEQLYDYLEAIRKEKYNQIIDSLNKSTSQEFILSAASMKRLGAYVSEIKEMPLFDLLDSEHKLNRIIHEINSIHPDPLEHVVFKIKGVEITDQVEEEYPVEEIYQDDELYSVEETYAEEVIIRPKGLFRKALTEMQTKTRMVNKTRIVNKVRIINKKRMISRQFPGKDVEIVFCHVPSGKLLMGDKKIEVIISKDFLIGKYPVTQDQWEAVMGENPSCFKLGPDHPVEQVSWEDCQRFIDKLNGIEGGGKYRLPTEAEWEFACRAYSTTFYRHGTYGLWEYAWYIENSDNLTYAVGQKEPNAWGLHDMHGNVWEWCQDRL